MTDSIASEADIAASPRGRGRPKAETIALTKAARARFDALAAESIEAGFQAVLTAATQGLLVDRVNVGLECCGFWRAVGPPSCFARHRQVRAPVPAQVPE